MTASHPTRILTFGALLTALLALNCASPARSADPAPVRTTDAPALLSAGDGEWVWLLWLRTGDGSDDGKQPTQVLGRARNKPWSRPHLKQLTTISTAAAQGDRLHVFLPDGRHYVYQAPRAESRLAEPLPTGVKIAAAAAAGNRRLYALAARDVSTPTTQPAAAPTTNPEALTASLTSQPDRPTVLEYSLFAIELGQVKELPAPPADLASADRVSMAVHRERPVVACLIDRTVHAWQLAGTAWQQLAPSTAPATRPEQQREMPPLDDLCILSVGNLLYAVGIPPADSGQELHIALLGETGLSGVGVVEGAPMPGARQQRRTHWDLAAHGDRIVFARLLRDEHGDTSMETRRYDPHNRTFEGAWQRIEQIKAPAWTRLFDNHWFAVVLIVLLVAMYMMRKPLHTIRIPADTMPASLFMRLLAGFIDLLPCFMLGMVFVYGYDWQSWPDFSNPELLAASPGEETRMLLAQFCGLGVLVGYRTLAEGLFGTTVGKRIFRLQVLTTRGTRANVGRILLRNLILAMELLPMGVPLLVALFYPSRQRLGDMVAGTIVLGPRRPEGPWVTPADEDRRDRFDPPADIPPPPEDEDTSPDEPTPDDTPPDDNPSKRDE